MERAGRRALTGLICARGAVSYIGKYLHILPKCERRAKEIYARPFHTHLLGFTPRSLPVLFAGEFPRSQRSRHRQLVGCPDGSISQTNSLYSREPKRTQSATAMRMTPAVISTPPSATFHEKDSPNMAKEISSTNTTLSLSIGATREAGPNCNAL